MKRLALRNHGCSGLQVTWRQQFCAINSCIKACTFTDRAAFASSYLLFQDGLFHCRAPWRRAAINTGDGALHHAQRTDEKHMADSAWLCMDRSGELHRSGRLNQRAAIKHCHGSPQIDFAGCSYHDFCRTREIIFERIADDNHF